MIYSKLSLKILLFSTFLITFFLSLSAQNGFRSGDGWGQGWGTTDYWSGTGFGNTFGKTYQNSSGNGNRYFRLYTDWSSQTREHGPSSGSDVSVPFNAPFNLDTYVNSGAYYLSVSGGVNNYNYVFRTPNGDGITNSPKLLVFEVQGAVQTVTAVIQSPVASTVTPSSTVEVTAATSGNLNVGQGLYLRYTVDNWTSSVIMPMAGSNTSYVATIPAVSSGTIVRYYIFTSGPNLTVPPNDADWYTINGNTNNGNNYSYTVGNLAPQVSVTPGFPMDDVQVTVTLDAAGTALASASKIYLHAGVSASESSPTLFQYTTGNWGQDDGIGEMTNISGDIWQIVLSGGLRSYFNVPPDKDIFGLNFLFRNATGTEKEDNNGNNFFNATDPVSYFNITFPVSSIYFTPVGQSFDHTAAANVAANNWTLKELDPNTNFEISILSNSTSGSNFLYTLQPINTDLRKFQLSADFNGTIKSKYFLMQGYLPVIDMPRPEWTKPGINYHDDDPTKATLVLHAPTYTRYYKGTGILAGMNSTTPKNLVHVVGDFNNWTTSETYKMYRDRDGWDGFTDADADGDRGDYWWLELTGLVPNQEYVFQYLIDGILQVADPYTHKVSDPDDHEISSAVYPGLITYRPQASDRASILQTNQADYIWTAEPFTKPSINELNIYELHFRDFTEEGTYLAAIEKLDYIKGLGINAIHVMPVSEFEGNSSWGYNPNFYFAADKAYGRADDLKLFIDECHKRKMQVFNDLVLNHAFYSNVMARMYWNAIDVRPSDDNPWFNAQHRMVADPAGWWGADWNHESEHTQRMVDDILDYWLQEFKFDGFRFDFTKGFGQTEQDPADPWASSIDADRIDLLERMVDGMKTRNPGSVAIFEHLAWASEDKILADQGILMWSGVGHHNDLKNFILGYSTDNTNIYDSGLYNATGRDFTYANWMSYGESHDEERLGYELMQYYIGTKNTTNIVKRLKLAYAFNLLYPGPRMLWQFGELGYDISINFNGRTGEKPVYWEYYDNTDRRELYTMISRIFKVRKKYNLYPTSDYGSLTNTWLGAGNLATGRYLRLSSNDGHHVIAIANLDPNNSTTLMPGYDVTGTWYKYNGNPGVDGMSFNVTSTTDTYTLPASDALILTNFQIDYCTDVRNLGDSGPNTLRDAIQCAPNNGIVNIEFPVHGQEIVLDSVITVTKNVVIEGFPSKNIIIHGGGYEGSVFSITPGHSVTINGTKMTCSQGNGEGRCIVNQGMLTLHDVELNDVNGSSTGSAILNTGSGTIYLENTVTINK